MTRPGARPPSPRPRASWRIVAGMAVASLAFVFCVIASVAYHWHRAATGAGIAVSVIAMTGCVAAAHLLTDDDQDGDQ